MIGKLAKETLGVELLLTVLESRAGFYLGTQDNGVPISRESEEYFADRNVAEAALRTGKFTQRMYP